MNEVWSEYVHLMSDPAHVAVEVTFILLVDVILLGLLWPLIKRWVRRHDESHHEGHTSEAEVDIEEIVVLTEEELCEVEMALWRRIEQRLDARQDA